MPIKTDEARTSPFAATTPEFSDLDRFLAACELTPSLRVLDVATGRGAIAFLLASEGLGNVVGVDVCPQNLTEAARVSARDNGPRFVCADASHLPFDDASFDLVVTRRGPHHFADIEVALDEIQRVLAVGGRFVVEDRSVPEDVSAAELWNEIDKLHAPSHVREYAPSAWRRMLEAREFDVEYLEPYERDLPLRLLLDGTSEESARAIEARLARVGDDMQRQLGLRNTDGSSYLRHNYVRLAARKRNN